MNTIRTLSDERDLMAAFSITCIDGTYRCASFRCDTLVASIVHAKALQQRTVPPIP